MRLKTLRKERPSFEIEGAVINGCRIDLSNNDLKPAKHRSNTSFALPASLHSESSPVIIPSSDENNEMNSRSRPEIVIPIAPPPSNLASYQAIESAYLERGIRIRLSPSRTATSAPQTGRKSANNLQRHAAFTSRNPSRTSSVLQYATTNQDQHHDSRSFSALQQTSSGDFEQTSKHNVSYAHSSQIDEETHPIYYSPSILVSENSNPTTLEKVPNTHDNLNTPTLYDNDPDLAYMSSLLQKSSGDSFRDTIRRRAGLRETFGVHRNPLTSNSFYSQQQSREKSPITNRNSLTRYSTIAVVPLASPRKIDKDILKHASRIRRSSQPKDYLLKSPRIDTPPIATSPPRTNNKRISIKKSLQSISLEPIQLLLLSPAPRSASLSARDAPTTTIKSSSIPHGLKTPAKRTKSAKTPTIEIQTNTNALLGQHTNSSLLLQEESLSLMKTSPLNTPRQTNSFDSGCYDRSSSSGDLQSLTSSSIVRIPSSLPSARLTNSTARRSHTNKKVSFSEEPTAVIVTTATYV